MSLFESRYLRMQEVAERNATAVIATFFLFIAVATAGVMSLGLDMSFRPLFASGKDIAEPTEEFEQVFGQSSGAWIAVILENTGNNTASSSDRQHGCQSLPLISHRSQRY